MNFIIKHCLFDNTIKKGVFYMCTAVNTENFFGRNLDFEHNFGEKVIITPRRFPFSFTKEHLAMIGVGIVENSYPLYFDAMNEKGVGMAGLNFPENAHYFPENENKRCIPSFVLIPFVLSQATSVNEAKELLENAVITNTSFSKNLSPSPLHWLVSDKKESLVIESTKEGLTLYDNPVGVLANSPPFPHHLSFLRFYLNVTSDAPENRFSKKLCLTPFSRGMGGIGLPGDLSSTSRFVRAAFMKENSKRDTISQFFHILTSALQIEGAAEVKEGEFEMTLYSSAYSREDLTLCYTTYENRRITEVPFKSTDGEKLITYTIEKEQDIKTV